MQRYSQCGVASTVTIAPVTPTGGVRDFSVPLISGGIAVLRVPFPMSEDDFKQLNATLKAWKKALVVKTEVRPPEPAGASSDEDDQ